MFDRHAIIHTMRSNPQMKFVSDVDEIRPDVGINPRPYETQDAGALTRALRTNQEKAASTLASGWKKVAAWYSDQLPPFNIILAGVNELGAASSMSIYGVEILNEGYGISIDDLVSEQQMTYVCREISPWTPLITPGDWGGVQADGSMGNSFAADMGGAIGVGASGPSVGVNPFG